MLRYYSYKGCGTCRKAKKWLAERSISVEEIAIRDTPPVPDELRFALESGILLKSLFNSSGSDYRELGMKDKLPHLSEDEAISLLHSRGNLIKRPFLVASKGALVGFKEEAWAHFFDCD